MKKSFRITAIVICNLVLLALLLETAGLVVYSRSNGRLFYTRSPEETTVDDEAPGRQPYSEYRIQPYWGYSTKPNKRQPHGKLNNNYGFRSAVDYPLLTDDGRQVIIGVFGGSVATQFTMYGAERLKEVLTGDSRFHGREPVVLNFGGGGYKQPQQLQILTYFLSQGQHFDMVVNIDGFNEVALSPFNRGSGMALALPSSLHMLPLVNLLDNSTLTPERLESLHRIARIRNRRRAAAARLGKTRSAAVYMVLSSWRRRQEVEFSREVNRFQSMQSQGAAVSLMGFAGVEEQVTDEESMFRQLQNSWSESSLLMHQLLAARGITYLHFLQPNQYYTERSFSREEEALALKEESLLRSDAARGYPHLQESGRWLQAQGVSFHDATGIFDDEPGIVYADSCCHYSQLGNELLAEFIAGRVLETWPH